MTHRTMSKCSTSELRPAPSVDSVRIPWNRSTVPLQNNPESRGDAIRTWLFRPQRDTLLSSLTNNTRNTYYSADSNYSCLPKHAPPNFSNSPVAFTPFVDTVWYESTNTISVTVYRRKIIIIIIYCAYKRTLAAATLATLSD